MTTKKTPGKPSPTRKPARKSPAPAKTSAKRNAALAEKPTAAAPKTVKSAAKAAAKAGGAPSPLDDFIIAAAQTLALPIDPEWLPAVRTNLEVTLRLGA